MPTIEVVRDAPRQNIAPIDESVLVPASVRRASAAADAIHAQAYADPNAPPALDPVAVVTPPVLDPAAVVTTPAPDPALAAPVADPPITTDGGDNDTTWHHRYLSMQGRWQASQRLIGDMQEQMTQMGDELVRSQQVIRARAPEPLRAGAPIPAAPATNLLTPQDTETYGTELIDFAKRAAQEAVAPVLTELREENQQLKKQVNGGRMAGALAQLGQAVPNWRDINRMPAWNNWLRQRDVYSGKLRHVLLNEANAAADAPRMTAFFLNFLAEQEATGQPVPTTQQVAPVVAPRVATIPLVTLAAPGRAKPAGGDTPAPADKPILTRPQIAEFYRRVRAGYYNGQEAEKAKDEAIIFAAQREGRVR